MLVSITADTRPCTGPPTLVLVGPLIGIGTCAVEGDLEVDWRAKDRSEQMEVRGISHPHQLPSSCPGHEDCLELLLEHSPFSYLEGNPFTPLHCAV